MDPRDEEKRKKANEHLPMHEPVTDTPTKEGAPPLGPATSEGSHDGPTAGLTSPIDQMRHPDDEAR